MENIVKDLTETRKGYAKIWNDFRHTDPEFTMSQLRKNKLPYVSRMISFLVKSGELYIRIIRHKKPPYSQPVYKFTEHPIHYSVFEKLLEETHVKKTNHKRVRNVNKDFNDISSVSNLNIINEFFNRNLFFEAVSSGIFETKISSLEDDECLVYLLRKRGWTVTATKLIEL